MVGASKLLNSSVYLGDLAESVTEQLIYDVFAQAGTIQSIRLCRDSNSRKPLGYAYVNFATPADATRALETLNHAELCGRQVRLMPSQRDPSARRSGVGNVFAKNLDPEKVTNKVLHEAFEKFGRVLSAKVATDSSGRSKGYGFVQFEDAESATKAIESLNLSELGGQRLYVGPFIPAKDRAVEPGKFCNVYVRNLGSTVDEEVLREVFGGFGAITSTVVMRNKSGRSRGFGFVNYEQTDHAAAAVAAMDGYRHEGLKWRVNRAQKRNEVDASSQQKQAGLVRSNLYLRNLDPTCTDEELRTLFEEFGAVENARVLKDGSGKGKGVGFVQFAEPEDAEAAITGMNGKTVGNSPKPLFVTLAQRKHPVQPSASEEMPQRDASASCTLPGSSGSGVLAPTPIGGYVPQNMTFFPASPSFFYGPMPMPVAGAHLMPNPYFVSMGSGPLAVPQQPVLDRRGSLISIPSGQYGIGPSPSAPVPRGGSIVSINSGPLPSSSSESRASAPLPMYGGLIHEGHRRGRKSRGRQGAVYTPQVLPYPPAAPASHQPAPRIRPVLTSPFSAVQAAPPAFLPTTRDAARAASMRARSSIRSMSSASSVATPHMLSGGQPGHGAEEAFAARRQSEQKRVLKEYVCKKNARWADEATRMLMERMNPPQIATLLTDSNALAMKVDACIATLEANAQNPSSSAPCAAEGQADGSSPACIPVPAT